MIQVEHVTKRCGRDTILSDVSVTFSPGAVYGLVGPNGSGKTTLMRCICGFVKPTSGQVTVNGKVIGKDMDFPQSTGIIIEAPGFLPQYSGLRNLLILADISRGADRQRAMAVMRRLGLDPLMGKPVGKYSLGMRQRLGIAQAILEDPDILILDEPMNGLDKQGMEDMHGLFREFSGQGKTILLASHSSQDIERACDTVCFMDSGRLSGGPCAQAGASPSRPGYNAAPGVPLV